MSHPRYEAGSTGVLLVDPYNDFLSEGGKLWPLVQPIAQALDVVAQLRRIVEAARERGMRVFYVPHHRAEPGDFAGWLHPSPDQLQASRMQVFARGTWGGHWHPDLAPRPQDVMVQEHWAQNGFANTDLDLQLKQHGVRQVVVIGLLANTCIEATARMAMELGYQVTLVKDATAAFSAERMHAAHALNGPHYAHAILDTRELLAAFAA